MSAKPLSFFYVAATALLLTLSLPVHAQIENGNFETWSNNQPSEWSTIDSGITLSRVTSPTSEGNAAAQITVTTATQSNTDLLQQVALQANQTYQFSVSVYHTEGNVRARLLVDGYQTYSDPTLRNQWQQISYTYTPTSNTTVSAGLRFYDISGFDGSEVVYVDDFQPSIGSTPPTTSCDENLTIVRLTTDNYGSETSWTLTNASGQTLASASDLANNQSYTETVCLSAGTYQFSINDAYGDGICCRYGSGEYQIEVNGQSVANGGEFASSESKSFTISGSGNGDGGNTGGDDNSGDLESYYEDASGLSGYPLKSALHEIINDHAVQGYGALWGFYSANELDLYYENDGSILDIYSENPNGVDAYTFTPITRQCGSYNSEADCYNREHSFPRSWFGGSIEPMNSDVHHIFATDGYVNSKRGSLPYGEVGTTNFVSNNGSRAGTAVSGLGYNGEVFEPNDEFKGDVARAQFYIATRYENIISNWQRNSSNSEAVLDGSSANVFEPWYLDLLKRWHQQDPVSQKELDRNNAALTYQGNRNPFVDHPEFVNLIWGN